MTVPGDDRPRCPWGASHPLCLPYHDEEWGVPLHDDQKIFEMLVLEGAQAGLSWLTILKRRPAYRRAFSQFDPQEVVRFDTRKVARLLNDAGIIRNRLKIESAIKNARAFLAVQKEFGSFDAYIWRFVDGQPKQNRWQSWTEVPARTQESDALSKDLKSRGFSFVGSTICYAPHAGDRPGERSPGGLLPARRGAGTGAHNGVTASLQWLPDTAAPKENNP